MPGIGLPFLDHPTFILVVTLSELAQCGGPDSIPVQSIWNVLCIKLYCNTFFPCKSGSHVTIIPSMLYTHILFIYHQNYTIIKLTTLLNKIFLPPPPTPEFIYFKKWFELQIKFRPRIEAVITWVSPLTHVRVGDRWVSNSGEMMKTGKNPKNLEQRLPIWTASWLNPGFMFEWSLTNTLIYGMT